MTDSDRDRGRDNDRDRGRDRERGRERDRERAHDRDRERHGGSSRDRERGRERERERDRDRNGDRGSDRDRRGSRSGRSSFKDDQKKHLDKLMAQPVGYIRDRIHARFCYPTAKPCCNLWHLQEKPISIPERPSDKKPPEPPEFVRFYMGESQVIA